MSCRSAMFGCVGFERGRSVFADRDAMGKSGASGFVVLPDGWRMTTDDAVQAAGYLDQLKAEWEAPGIWP